MECAVGVGLFAASPGHAGGCGPVPTAGPRPFSQTGRSHGNVRAGGQRLLQDLVVALQLGHNLHVALQAEQGDQGDTSQASAEDATTDRRLPDERSCDGSQNRDTGGWGTELRIGGDRHQDARVAGLWDRGRPAVSRGGPDPGVHPSGVDLSRHPLSLLSLGDLGWIQIANFVVTGVLYVACAVGMRRALGPGPGACGTRKHGFVL
jgi:hypothetical protein